ncbi:hypothetical protein GGR51DRAFT_247729 [Nemania sp. FL0031]|nr:hypothetical protein GGR51DRAFT_247729 [Nemania sp. FL0031]
MQGDIFQLETLVAVPKPQPITTARTTSDSSVAIYNEDDLSHLLYVSNSSHHHHHHHQHKHHHHHVHEQKPFTHPADNAGMVLINTVVDDLESLTPALSDCESCSGSETSGVDTPPLSLDFNDDALEAYRRKGRRNALSFEDGFEFPIFLGRQDEEEWHVVPKSLLQQQPIATAPVAVVPVKAAPSVPATQHVAAIGGPLMSWWPEPMETAENTWDIENMKWELQLEREKLDEREREGGIALVPCEKKTYEEARPVAEIEGPLMSWWPEPLETMEYEWSERFYE